jgi:hypothetical protein
LNCDFCLEVIDVYEQKHYTHFTEPFALAFTGPDGKKLGMVDFDEEWLACPGCHDCIKVGDSDALLERSSAASGMFLPEQFALDGMVETQCAFWMNYGGEWSKDFIPDGFEGIPIRQEVD